MVMLLPVVALFLGLKSSYIRGLAVSIAGSCVIVFIGCTVFGLLLAR